MSTIKYSRQRAAIKDFLMSRHDHPTADTIYTAIRREYPSISLGTVYRNLTLLEEMGEIIRLSPDQGPDHYDAKTHPHYHFTCRKCGCVSDLDLPMQDDITKRAGKTFPGIIDSHVTFFYGTCADCLDTSRH